MPEPDAGMGSRRRAGPDIYGRSGALRGLIELVRARWSDRPDSEHEQALVRLVLGLLAVAFIYSPLVEISATELRERLETALLLFLGAAAVLLVLAMSASGVSVARRALGMAIDVGTTSYVMALGGEAATPLIAVYLWITTSNGFRYGAPYLIAATVLSAVGFATVVLTSEHWRAYPLFSLSLLIVLLALPAYVAVLLRKLREAIGRANEANRAKSRFLANMSHELRTPLNGVIGMSDLLIGTQLNSEQRELARTIQSSAHSLLELLDDVLDISKIEAGKLAVERTEFDLHRLVGDVCLMFHRQAQEKGLAFEVQIDPRIPYLIHGDPLHLRQILVNLVSNAVKFTETGSVSLSLIRGSAPVDELRVRFEVTDTGIGISKDRQTVIFESFTQADSTTSRRFGGTGLGTTIARQLVELMGGRMGVHSREGVGSTFWFELPLSCGDREMGDIPAAAIVPPATRALILAGSELGATLEGLLRSWGLQPARTSSTLRVFSELLQAVEVQNPYSVVIVDRQQLDTAAADFATAIRAEPLIARTSLILIQPTGVESDRAGGGYLCTLNAPVDALLLSNAVHAATVGLRSASEEGLSITARTAPSGLRILLAEDNETNRRVLETVLTRAGHSVASVEDGEQALGFLRDAKDPVDLVLVDMNMPRLGGLDLVRTARTMARYAHTPMLVLTADATREAREACVAAGADAYLAKPVEPHALVESVERLVLGDADGPSPALPQTDAASPAQHPGDQLADPSVLDALLSLGSGLDFLTELMEGFERDSARNLDAMDRAVESRDSEAWRDAVHALRGSAIEFGAHRLVTLCTEAEGLDAAALTQTDLAAFAHAIHETYRSTRAALRDYAKAKRGGE